MENKKICGASKHGDCNCRQTWQRQKKKKGQPNKQTNKQTKTGGWESNKEHKCVIRDGCWLTDKGLDSKEGHEADRVGGLGKSKALVEVEATDHADGGDIVVTQETENKLASVSSNYRRIKQQRHKEE